MNLIVMNIFTNTLDTLLVFYFQLKILQKKKKIKKDSIILLGSLIIFNTLINHIFGLTSFGGFIVIFIASTIVYGQILNQNFVRTLIYSILGTVFMFIIELIVVNTLILIFNIQPSIILEHNIYRLSAIVVSKGSFYLVIKYLIEKLKVPRYMIIENVRPLIVIGIFNILIVCMSFTLYKYIEIESIVGYIYLTVMGIGAIIFSWIMYTISKKIIYQHQQEIIWKVKEEEFLKTDFYIKSMNDILQTIKSQRHDLNNYLTTLYGLIYMDSFEEAKQYITKINDRIINMNKIIETNHPVITALVSMKKNKAFDHDIDMKLDINLPEVLPFDFVDLSIVIGNLLDNAIEACQAIEEIERVIDVCINIEEECLTIYVNNTKSESIKLDTKNICARFTTKSNQESHGFGLGNVEFVVNQYNGIMDIEDLGKEFRVQIVLPMK